MTEEEFTAYHDGRYTRAIKYYDDRAKMNQRWHHICSIYVLVTSVVIAPLLSIDSLLGGYGRIFAAVLAPTVAIVAGVASHFRFNENWLSYRATWDALQHEIHWRDAKNHGYKTAEDRNALFVERVEALISREGSEWLDRHIRKESAARLTETKL
jgi:hypothetical protein